MPIVIQRAALGQSQGLVKSLPEISTGWLANGHTTASVQPGKEKFARETFEKNKQNLDDRPSAAGCMRCEAKATKSEHRVCVQTSV